MKWTVGEVLPVEWIRQGHKDWQTYDDDAKRRWWSGKDEGVFFKDSLEIILYATLYVERSEPIVKDAPGVQAREVCGKKRKHRGKRTRGRGTGSRSTGSQG